MSSLAEDVARLRQVLEFQDGPAIVAGHSYGGQIMTALDTNAPNVVGLVYIAAFGIDEASRSARSSRRGPVTPALAHLFTDGRCPVGWGDRRPGFYRKELMLGLSTRGAA